MRWLLLFISIVSILLFSTFGQRQVYHKGGEVENDLVTISGIAMGNRLCNDKCVKIYGANVSGGWKTVTGRTVKKRGETILFVQRIE
mgnify:FL=1